jgi:hypothetical protein
MDPIQTRIDRAWQKCKSWITEFDGSATETYLPNVTPDTLAAGLTQLAPQTLNFRISKLSSAPAGEYDEGEDYEEDETEDRPEFISLEALPAHVTMLQKDEIAGLSINYTARLLEDLDLDLHIVIHPAEKKKIDLELVWWADQVFIEEETYLTHFAAAIRYFIELQALFVAPKLFIGAENLEEPGPESIQWMEI